MISEVEKILKGSVVKSQEYDSLRKLIGVANQNLVPNANGDISLAKQRAFIEEKKDETALETLNETLNLGQNTSDKVEQVNLNTQIQTNQVSDQPQVALESEQSKTNIVPEQPQKFTSELNNAPVLENPIQVEDPNVLTKLTNPLEEIQNEEPKESVVEEQKVVMDLQMPQLPENIVAEEPVTTNNNLFETNLNNNVVSMEEIQMPQLEEISNIKEESENKVENNNLQNIEPAPIKQEAIELNDIKVVEAGKQLLEIANEFSNTINKTIDNVNKFLASEQYTELIKFINIISNNNSVSKTTQTPKEQNSLVNDALNQINNMVIPSMNNQMKL